MILTLVERFHVWKHFGLHPRALELLRGPILPTALWYLPRRATGEFGMPDRAALIAVLIMERPLCVSCISSKTGLTHGEVESYLTRIEGVVAVKQALDRCRTCGSLGPVFSLLPRD